MSEEKDEKEVDINNLDPYEPDFNRLRWYDMTKFERIRLWLKTGQFPPDWATDHQEES